MSKEITDFKVIIPNSKLNELEAALRAFGPDKIGYCQSLDHAALEDAWIEAKRVLAQIDAEPADDQSDDLVKTARRAEGSDLLPKVSFGVMNAEVLILRMADRIEELVAEVARLRGRTAHAEKTLKTATILTAREQRSAMRDTATDTVPKTADNDASQ